MSLTVTAYELGGKSYTLNDIQSLMVSAQLDVPADTLTVTAPIESYLPELVRVSVTSGSTPVFMGVIDVQTVSVSAAGRLLTIKARGLAAPLLDNEAVPGVYSSPYLSDMWARYVGPLGKTLAPRGFTLPNRRVAGVFTVDKGASLWQVFHDFAARTAGGVLRVDETGLLTQVVKNTGSKLTFGEGAIGFLKAESVIRRHRPVSRVVTVDEHTQSYTLEVHNYSLMPRGIERTRYMRYFDRTAVDKHRAATDLMKESAAGSRTLELTLPGVQMLPFGAPAKVTDSLVGVDGYVLCARTITADREGLRTTVTLWPAEDVIE